MGIKFLDTSCNTDKLLLVRSRDTVLWKQLCERTIGINLPFMYHLGKFARKEKWGSSYSKYVRRKTFPSVFAIFIVTREDFQAEVVAVVCCLRKIERWWCCLRGRGDKNIMQISPDLLQGSTRPDTNSVLVWKWARCRALRASPFPKRGYPNLLLLVARNCVLHSEIYFELNFCNWILSLEFLEAALQFPLQKRNTASSAKIKFMSNNLCLTKQIHTSSDFQAKSK